MWYGCMPPYGVPVRCRSGSNSPRSGSKCRKFRLPAAAVAHPPCRLACANCCSCSHPRTARVPEVGEKFLSRRIWRGTETAVRGKPRLEALLPPEASPHGSHGRARRTCPAEKRRGGAGAHKQLNARLGACPHLTDLPPMCCRSLPMALSRSSGPLNSTYASPAKTGTR